MLTPTLETQTKAVRYKHNFPGQISSNRHQKRQTRKHAWKNLWENDGICQSTTWKAETWNHSFGGDPVASIRELDLEVLQQLQSIWGYAKRTEMTVTYVNVTESSCPVPVQCFLLGLQKRISQGWMLFQKQTFHKSKGESCPEASINSINKSNKCRNTLLGHRFTVFAWVWISCQCEQWALIHLATFVVEPSASL